MKENVHNDLKAYSLMAQIGSNFGVAGAAQGHSIYYYLDTKGFIGGEMIAEGVMLDVNLESTLMPTVTLVESMDGGISDEDQQKVYNISGYCSYHNIEFSVMTKTEYSAINS